MRISDWSSDVCSSDLSVAGERLFTNRVLLRRALLPSRHANTPVSALPSSTRTWSKRKLLGYEGSRLRDNLTRRQILRAITRRRWRARCAFHGLKSRRERKRVVEERRG